MVELLTVGLYGALTLRKCIPGASCIWKVPCIGRQAKVPRPPQFGLVCLRGAETHNDDLAEKWPECGDGEPKQRPCNHAARSVTRELETLVASQSGSKLDWIGIFGKGIHAGRKRVRGGDPYSRGEACSLYSRLLI
jgi:hypothetical protein